MKIGVAVPCYHGHINNLLSLLDSIDAQTILPNKVAVSCSSTDKLDITKKYKFDLEIIIINEKQNAAQNRNNASSKLADMDYVTFIDADDIMHPQKIEILLKTIHNYDSDIILHNFQSNPYSHENMFEPIEHTKIRTDTLIQAWSGCITHINGYDDRIDQIHHSQPTVKTWILNKIKFPEEPEYHAKEDSVFCHRVFSLPGIKHAYILNPLTYYKQSKTMDYFS
jgi:glycosyltransferase involved in cell wall biosynthesis